MRNNKMSGTTRPVFIFFALAAIIWLLSSWLIAGLVIRADMGKIIEQEQQDLDNKAEYLAGNIRAHIKYLQNIPQSLGKEENILKILSSPVVATTSSLPVAQRKETWTADPLLKETDKYLKALAGYMNASVIYVLDASGKCVLSSNADMSTSFVGADYNIRDYYTNAVNNGNGYQYAMGSISNIPGLYFSSSIIKDGQLVGVAVVKINLSNLSPWINKARAYLTDEYGVIVLAYDEHMEMHSVPDNRLSMLSTEKLVQRYKRSSFPLLAISQWPEVDLPPLYHFDADNYPVLIASKQIQPELILHATQEERQISTSGKKRLGLFTLTSLSGLLLLSLAMWRIATVRNRQRVEKEIEDNETRLRTAQHIAQVGSFEWNPVTGELKWSDEHFRLWGLQPHSVTPSYDLFLQFIHPDDATRIETTLQQALNGDSTYDCEHRVVWPDGSEHAIHGRGEITFDNTGQPIRMSGTVQDITERKQAEQELITARNDAERANRAKSEFLSSMSHELRTPLNAVLGFAQLIQLDANLNPEHKDGIQEILNGAGHLLHLINEVLELSKIESGNLNLSLNPIQVSLVINDCLTLIRGLANNKNVQLQYIAQDEAIVYADRFRLKQALLNLLSNAVKYNRDGGSVIVKVHPGEPGQMCIQVTDTGQGIPADKLGELFHAFNRLGAENGVIEGTGIGLTITKRIVEMMGGTVGVETESGVGSSFWITLPIAQAPALQS